MAGGEGVPDVDIVEPWLPLRVSVCDTELPCVTVPDCDCTCDGVAVEVSSPDTLCEAL